MTRKLAVAGLLMAAWGALARWQDAAHLLAGGLAIVALVMAAAIVGALRHRGAVEDLDEDLAEEGGGSGSILRDGVAGVLLGGAGLAVAALIYSYLLPPFYPLLVGDCPTLVPKLDIYEETTAWPRAVALIDARLRRPLDRECYAELAGRKCRYLIEWSKTLPREEADAKLAEAERWAQSNNLADYRTIAQMMRAQLQPTPPPSPILVTPTPSPAPTPRRLLPGTTVQLTGVDAAYFPPTLFAYLRVVGPDGQPIGDLAASDVRVEDDGQPVSGCSLSHYSRAPAAICAALAIDYSGSMSGEPLTAAKAGARAFLGFLGAKDQAAIVGFNDRPQMLQSWTSDRQAAMRALDLLPAQNWTALWDALWLAGEELGSCSGRKVVVVLTDGADNRSQHTRDEVVAQARRVGLSIFAIGLRTAEYDGQALQELVQAVGGRYLEASSPDELETHYREMVGAIKSEYRLALTLDRRPDGNAHLLRVQVGGPDPLAAELSYQDPAGG